MSLGGPTAEQMCRRLEEDGVVEHGPLVFEAGRHGSSWLWLDCSLEERALTLNCVASLGSEVRARRARAARCVGLASMNGLSQGQGAVAAEQGVPSGSLLALESELWIAEQCTRCAAGEPLVNHLDAETNRWARAT